MYYEYTSSWGPKVKNIMVFESVFIHIFCEQPTKLLNFLALHSSHTENITLNDFVILAERNPLSSPISNSLLQYVYGFFDSSIILFLSVFLRCLYFLDCLRNSGVKYVL